MKNFLILILFMLVSNISFGQMISVTGGNLSLHGKDKGYVEIEAMQHITKNVAAHISYTKTLGGYDITMVGGRYGFNKNRLGVMLSACYMVDHKTMAMVGVDFRPIKKNPISIVYSQSSDNQLKTIGLKFPIWMKEKSHH